MNLSTESISRASAEHAWATIGAWVVVLVVAVTLIVTLLASALTTEFDFTSNPESMRGFKVMEERFKDLRRANEVVIVTSKPESTEGGRRVSVLRRQEGAPVLLG